MYILASFFISFDLFVLVVGFGPLPPLYKRRGEWLDHWHPNPAALRFDFRAAPENFPQSTELIGMSTWLHRDLEKKNEGEIDTNLMSDPDKNAVSNPSFQNDLYPLSLSPALLLRFRDQRNKEKRQRVHGPKRSECKWFTGLMSKTSLTLSFLRRYLPW